MTQEKSVTTKFTTLFIDPVVMRRIMYYTEAATGEVSGLGTITRDEKGRHVVSKVYLLEQEASAADTELKPEAISKLMVDMMKEEQDPAALKFWWHSHASMGVFWSGTDDTCAETLSKEFAFSLVVNKAGDKRCRLDLYSPFRITFDGVKVEELKQEDVDLKAECEKEVKEKVKSAYEKYTNWSDRDGYEGYGGYMSGHHRGVFGRHSIDTDKKCAIKLPENIVKDIKRLVDHAALNSDRGGTLCIDTWNEYILETLKECAESRFEKRAGCNSFGTYDKEYDTCKKECKIIKACQYWTKLFQESEDDAEKLGNGIEVINVQ